MGGLLRVFQNILWSFSFPQILLWVAELEARVKMFVLDLMDGFVWGCICIQCVCVCMWVKAYSGWFTASCGLFGLGLSCQGLHLWIAATSGTYTTSPSLPPSHSFSLLPSLMSVYLSPFPSFPVILLFFLNFPQTEQKKMSIHLFIHLYCLSQLYRFPFVYYLHLFFFL